MIDWKNLKSAVEITDPDEAFAKLRAAFDEKNAAPVGRKGHTYVSRAKDGSVAISKQSSLVAAGDGSPAPMSAADLYSLIMARGVGKTVDGKDPAKSIVQRVVPYWASDERVDAHGDIVKANWHFDEFAKNPVMPFGHSWGETPVGTYLDWRVLERRSSDYSGPALWLLGIFADDPKSESVFRLVKGGYLKAASVGFSSKKLIDVKDDAERAALGLGRYGYVLDENHLLENSPVTIGANPGALSILSRMRAQDALKENDFLVIRELQRRQVVKGAGDKTSWAEEDRKTVAMCKMLFADSDMRVHANLDEPIVGAVPSDEERLRNYRPPAVSAKATSKGMEQDIAEILTALQSQGTFLEQMALSVQSQLDDISTALDELIAEEQDEEPAEPGEPSTESHPKPAGTNRGGKEGDKTGDQAPKISLLARVYQRREDMKQNS